VVLVRRGAGEEVDGGEEEEREEEGVDEVVDWVGGWVVSYWEGGRGRGAYREGLVRLRRAGRRCVGR
jgi:hypothetical protein